MTHELEIGSVRQQAATGYMYHVVILRSFLLRVRGVMSTRTVKFGTIRLRQKSTRFGFAELLSVAGVRLQLSLAEVYSTGGLSRAQLLRNFMLID